LTVVPPQVDDSGQASAVDWTALFDAAGLPMSEFRAVEPTWVPNGYADQRAAWEGPLPGQPHIQLRAEAGAYRGRPVFFQIVGPWTRPTRQIQEPLTTATRLVRFGEGVIILLLLVGTFGLARHNVRSGRGDRRGATRVSLFVLGAFIASWLVGARHSLEIQEEINLFLRFMGLALVDAGILWLAYVALEPYVRRYSPEILMSWTRLLGGRFRDPRVGRDVLMGIIAGVVIGALRVTALLIPNLLDGPPPPPQPVNLQFLLGTHRVLAILLRLFPDAVQNAMLVTLIFVVMQMAVKRAWLAAVIAGTVFGFLAMGDVGSSQLFARFGFATVSAVVFMMTLLYFGLLAQAVAFLVNSLLAQSPLTADFSKLYATTSIWLLAFIAGVAVLGYYASRSGQSLLGITDA